MDDGQYADALLDAALRYAAGGLYVFPARVERPDPAQHAKTARFIGQWRKASTTDPATITARWGPDGAWRGAHVCVAMGESGLVGLDADGPEGVAELETLAAEHGWPEPIAKVATPSGGQHWIYRENYRRVIGVDSTGKLAPHVDVRGMGGLMYAAPSRDSAGAYRHLIEPDWAAHTVVPDLVADRMKAERPVEPVPAVTTPAEPDPFDPPSKVFTKEQATKEVAKWMKRLGEAPDGQINDTLNSTALVAYRFVPTFWSREEMDQFLLLYLGKTVWDDKSWKAQNTLNSAWRRAELQWKADEADPFDAGVEQVVKVTDEDVEKLRAELLDTDGLDSIEDLHPLIKDWLSLDSIARVNGKSGAGKSFVVLDMAGHIGTGREWHGHRVAKGEVVYLVAEGARGIRKRVRAWEKYHDVRMTGVHFLPRPINANAPEWNVLGRLLREIGPALVAIDTQARVTVGMNENDNSEMGVMVDRVEAIRRETGACVLLVHHLGHNGEEGRGATAVKGAMQTELLVDRGRHGQVVLSNPKQKDGPDDLVMTFDARPVVLGQDEDGRDVTSLVLAVTSEESAAQADPFDGAGEGLNEDQSLVVKIMFETWPVGDGGTQAQVATQFVARYDRAKIKARGSAGPSVAAIKKRFYRAWAQMEEDGRLVKIKGRGTYRFVPLDELNVTESTVKIQGQEV